LLRSAVSGLTFGNGIDLFISNDANTVASSFTNPGRAYSLPSGYTYRSPASQSYLANGEYRFVVSNIEVYVMSLMSGILSFSQHDIVTAWVGVKSAPWVRCFASDKDGTNAALFHHQCDHRGATLLLAKTADNQVIGAYSAVPFRSRNNYAADSSAFLFQFTSDTEGKRWYPWFGDVYTLNDMELRFPSYGSTDLLLPQDISKDNATSQLGSSFNGTGSIGGTTSFRIVQLEVFTLGNTSDVSCYGVSANSQMVCGRVGMCIGTNRCKCNPGWTGPTCSIPTCFNLTSTNTQVCSGLLLLLELIT
jgi:hypothetical protein